MSSQPAGSTEPRLSLELATLRRLYAEGAMKPTEVIRAIYRSIAARGDDAVWITICPEAEALARARQMESRIAEFSQLPLFGAPFAIKDKAVWFRRADRWIAFPFWLSPARTPPPSRAWPAPPNQSSQIRDPSRAASLWPRARPDDFALGCRPRES